MHSQPESLLGSVKKIDILGPESDSVKSAGKAEDKLHKACERVSEICERTLHRQAHGKHERVTRQ